MCMAVVHVYGSGPCVRGVVHVCGAWSTCGGSGVHVGGSGRHVGGVVLMWEEWLTCGRSG